MSPEAGALFWSHAALVPVLLPCVSHLGGANAPREAAFALTTAALAEGEAPGAPRVAWPSGEPCLSSSLPWAQEGAKAALLF